MPINIEVAKRVALLTIDFPPANALSSQCAAELGQAVDEALDAQEARVMIITGAGAKFFVGGADVAELAGFDDDAGQAAVRAVKDTFKRLSTCALPVLAAINGVAAGGGLELALACDFRLAAENAVLGVPEIKLGVMPGAGGSQLLPRVVGPAMALQLMLSGELISARRALALGLVNSVHGPALLMDDAMELAQRLAHMPPLAVAQIKGAVQDAMNLPLDQGLEKETERFGRLCASSDKAEGVAAFKERRAPNFTGR